VTPDPTLTPSAARRERERQETRERILDAARELFVREGFEKVTMRAIADRIAYTPTAIYHHFADKESLIAELCRNDFRALAGRFAKIERIADPVERLRKFGQAYVAFALELPEHYRFLFMTQHPPEQAHPEKGSVEEDAYGMLREVVSDCIAQGRFRAEYGDPERTAQMCWANCHGVVSLHLNFHDDPWLDWKDARGTSELAMEALIRGMVG
jgi:AcrR family transcriptional regulator